MLTPTPLIAGLPWSGWAILVLVALMVGISKTALSGLTLVASALAATVLPARESTGTVLTLLITGDIVAVWAYRQHADFRTIRRLLGPVLAGVALGAVFLNLVDDLIMRRTIGVILLGLLLLSIWRDHLRVDSKGAAIGYGSLAGFTTMVANAGGPPMTLYMLAARFDKMRFLGTTAWFFCIVNLLKVPVSIGVGAITLRTFGLWATLAPAVLLGAFAGKALIGRINQKLFERIVTGLVLLAALNLTFL